ncbi:MAG: hypothetical protein MR031_03500, partial [Tenericutes bacterium]|nr:hypothetical protein [Mycoplasmatota bacterium]
VMLEKIIKIILIVAWMGLIFMFSNDTAVESSKKSDGFIIKTVQVVLERKLDSQEYINYNYLSGYIMVQSGLKKWILIK